ncbi:hypothetical protein D1007_03398 [Hordeum vulgare]|nr:hypothetical protein D1007_03398 [Hordeum vulgare]
MVTTVLAVAASAAPAPPPSLAARFSPVSALLQLSSCETGGETANTSSVMSDNSIDDKGLLHLGLNNSEADRPVLEEDLVLFDNFNEPESVPSLCIAVIGATGELARSKVFPALFALYYSGFLPQNVAIFGYSRKTLADEDLRSMIESNLTCRVDHQIDHLLGKDLIENLTVLRFSNLVFEPLWSRKYIRNVQVVFSEETSTETQGRYFGNYGIIRDIVHSHILQTIALFAMEPPVSLDGEDIRDEKVKVLRSIRKVDIDDVVLGQLKNTCGKVDQYTKSMTPTYLAAAMYIDNARWDGVPFLIKTGMGLMENRAEIRIQFITSLAIIYRERFGHDLDLDTNELVLHGDSHLFMRSDELAAAWSVLAPILHEIDQKRVAPELYEAGDKGTD